MFTLPVEQAQYGAQTFSLRFDPANTKLLVDQQQPVNVPPFHVWRVVPQGPVGWAGLPIPLQLITGIELLADSNWHRRSALSMTDVVQPVIPTSYQPVGIAGGYTYSGAELVANFTLEWAPFNACPPVVLPVSPRLLTTASAGTGAVATSFIIPPGTPGLWVEGDDKTKTYRLEQLDLLGGVVVRVSCGTVPPDAASPGGVSGVIACAGLPRPSIGRITVDAGTANVRVWAP